MNKRSNDALIALRQIQRKTESASKKLAQMAGLTPSQLMLLEMLHEKGQITAGEASRLTKLKHATITSLVDKLVAKGLVDRIRSAADKRRVWLALLPAGERAIINAPDLLHGIFIERFDALPDWHQSMLVSSLERVAALLDAEDLDAAPILDVGVLTEKPI